MKRVGSKPGGLKRGGNIAAATVVVAALAIGAVVARDPCVLVRAQFQRDPGALDLYAAKMPQAAKVLLDDCGHMSLMEKPGAVADAVVA